MMLTASASILLVCPLLALTLFQIPARAGPAHYCSGPDTYAEGSVFEFHLLSLLEFLSSNATSHGNFYALSVGDVPDTVYGLIMCYADASADDCRVCLKDATSNVQQYCSGQATAIFFYEECLLRYSSKDFRSQVADFNEHYCVANTATLDDESKNLVTNLISNASMAAEEDPQLTAYRVTMTKTTTTPISALAQCTRDLSQDGCRQCLQGGYESNFSACSYNLTRTGMRLVFGSCYLRYESYYLHNINLSTAAAGSTVSGKSFGTF